MIQEEGKGESEIGIGRVEKEEWKNEMMDEEEEGKGERVR